MGQKRKNRVSEVSDTGSIFDEIRTETLRSIVALLAFTASGFFLLAAFDSAGRVGTFVYKALAYLFGIGFFMIPTVLVIFSWIILRGGKTSLSIVRGVAALGLFTATLGLIGVTANEHGGVIGQAFGVLLRQIFDIYVSILFLCAIIVSALLILFNAALELSMPTFRSVFERFRGFIFDRGEYADNVIAEEGQDPEFFEKTNPEHGSDQKEDFEENVPVRAPSEPLATSKIKHQAVEPLHEDTGTFGRILQTSWSPYEPPPLSLLEKDRGKASVGDTKANANIIKRALQNFGIQVEIDEISVGPTVTRYALKPAEGVRISKIVSLQSNIELALAASPIRIEAPIPGKSLVGIEVPNSAKALVGLGSLIGASPFVESQKTLLTALGRDIAGTPHYADIAKMPHLLIAGTTGSGKSVTIHGLITSLLYRNGPNAMRFIMIDPKRVELTLYNGIPHLLSPVITDAKKAILALKWAAKEMDRRYDILETEKVRDIHSYHESVVAPAMKKMGGRTDSDGTLPEPMPYVVIVVDELADIMQTYPREMEAAVVRLAQMSRAVGIHLVLSTQRPSVNVITGLIKANIPARAALQVSSQIDSRTILDMGGAEKLLGAGDMLYLSGDMAKPLRLQSAFISESEVKNVVNYLKKTDDAPPSQVDFTSKEVQSMDNPIFSGSLEDEEEIDDELYERAKDEVVSAGKASTSYLQRRLRIGYARAARLMDVLEERGVIGPQDGSRPREILVGTKDTSADTLENDDAVR